MPGAAKKLLSHLLSHRFVEDNTLHLSQAIYCASTLAMIQEGTRQCLLQKSPPIATLKSAASSLQGRSALQGVLREPRSSDVRRRFSEIINERTAAATPRGDAIERSTQEVFALASGLGLLCPGVRLPRFSCYLVHLSVLNTLQQTITPTTSSAFYDRTFRLHPLIFSLAS